MKYLKSFEIYSSDKNKILEFINGLDDELILYRVLIIKKDDDNIDKDNLGIHWTLDENFADNIYRYGTFGHIRDCYLYKITVEIKKEDIDIGETIEVRHVKDNKFFWDEISGEMIENDDMDGHPYSHEDEIILKKDAKPKIINIDKIDGDSINDKF